MLISLAALLLFISLIPYMIYFFGIYFGKKPVQITPLQKYPLISIIISAYNEEKVIGKRIANIKECLYPTGRYELIFVDDCSSDNTKNLAEISLEQSGIDYQIIANTERLGTTRSYNSAIKMAKYPIIVTTDADVFLNPMPQLSHWTFVER
jgi:cellulose synthase/poly-beta-1,6-N-acetylglucosamine synthase-like glycosyltransferase